MGLNLPSFESCIVTNAPEQRLFGDVQVPCVLSPPATSGMTTTEHVSQFVKEYRSKIDQALEEHGGAVLFRGFPLGSPEDFNTFVQAFDGWKDLSYDRSMSFAVRKRLTDRICTTNEGKVSRLLD